MKQNKKVITKKKTRCEKNELMKLDQKQVATTSAAT